MNPKTILITGAARRVGAAIATALHAAGDNVIVHCHRSRTAADALAAGLNAARADSARVIQGDLGNLGQVKAAALIADAHACFGRLDGLVNNASAFYATPMGTIQEADWDALVGSNLKAPLFLAQAAAPFLRETKGSIVNIVDIHAERPLKDFVVYTLAKAGLAGLTRALALELGPSIRVNGVSPGAILWPEEGDSYPHDERERIVHQTPLQRIGSPADIAGAVKFLLHDAPYVSGQIIAVDGGRSLML